MSTGPETAGWSVGQSIALDLDVALTAVRRYLAGRGMPEEIARLVAAMPADWQEQGRELLGAAPHPVVTVAAAASLAGVLEEPDYSRATLAIRECTLSAALDRAAELARPLGLAPAGHLPPDGQLLDLLARMEIAAYQKAGFEPSPAVEHSRIMQAAGPVVRVLAGGDLHTRFWHWLDRFYYEFFRPWRTARAAEMDALTQRAVAALGAPARRGLPPDLGWLSTKNPLRVFPQLSEQVRTGAWRVFFWVDPFHLFDMLALFPGLVAVSFHEPGSVYADFRAEAERIAAQARAVSDPTRLTILRLIRHFGMDNTEMAAYLGLARPTVSIHAKVLREAGLIESTPHGREIHHTVNAPAVRKFFRDLEEFLDLPD